MAVDPKFHDKVRTLLEKGMTVQDVADELDVTTWLIYKIAKQHRIYNDKENKKLI